MEKRVLVFKTSVRQNQQVEKLKPAMNALFGKNEKWNFDLEDCDNILRVETHRVSAGAVVGLLNQHGFLCQELD